MGLALQHHSHSLLAPPPPKPQIKSSTHHSLALALGVIKSKPADISLDEFISQVILRIQAVARPKEIIIERKHLDSAAFWREAYEKSEAAQSKLLDRVYELEQKLESTSQTGRPGVEKPNAKKRKVVDAVDQTAEIDARSKRQKSKAPGKGAEESTTAIDNDFTDADELGTTAVGNTILRPFFHLHKAITQRKPNPATLASASSKLCTAASLAISIALGPPTNEKTQSTQLRGSNPQHPGDQPQNLATILAVVETKGYPLVLRALGKARALEDGGRSQRKITYSLVTLFRMALEQLHAMFVRSCREQVDAEKEVQRKKTLKGRNLTLKKGAGTPKALDPRTPQLLSRVLAHMISNLDASRPESADLLEGYLACLLDQVGKRLCVVTFGQENMRADSFAADGGDIHQTRSRGLGDSLRDDVDRRAAKEESRYLTRILKRGLGFAKANQHLLVGCQDVEGQRAGEETSFLEIVKRRLQNTLLKGVFGNDDVFQEALGWCESNKSEASSEAGDDGEEDETSGDRFTREVWDLIGWDILTGLVEFTTEREGTLG